MTKIEGNQIMIREGRSLCIRLSSSTPLTPQYCGLHNPEGDRRPAGELLLNEDEALKLLKLLHYAVLGYPLRQR